MSLAERLRKPGERIDGCTVLTADDKQKLVALIGAAKHIASRFGEQAGDTDDCFNVTLNWPEYGDLTTALDALEDKSATDLDAGR